MSTRQPSDERRDERATGTAAAPRLARRQWLALAAAAVMTRVHAAAAAPAVVLLRQDGVHGVVHLAAKRAGRK